MHYLGLNFLTMTLEEHRNITIYIGTYKTMDLEASTKPTMVYHMSHRNEEDDGSYKNSDGLNEDALLTWRCIAYVVHDLEDYTDWTDNV